MNQIEAFELWRTHFPVYENRFHCVYAYFEALMEANQNINFVSRKLSPSELWLDHIMECATAVYHLPKGPCRVLDLGTGGGLPGAVIAALRPELRLFLADKSPKKLFYLNRILKAIPLQGAQTLLFPLSGETPEIDLLISRAVGPAERLLRFWSEAGWSTLPKRILLFKSTAEQAEEDIQALPKNTFSAQIHKSPQLNPEKSRHFLELIRI